eukprot:TRINITY_DN32127_c0_g1_i1.p1 TRINITY_DN32127_c0_g1~~TRINITY_DN32127_c0_g1_i1.p1  ORF type:complete len:599 (-),score=117.65 TRINITY_DN32127_c0_g1_i1:434-2230(-)
MSRTLKVTKNDEESTSLLSGETASQPASARSTGPTPRANGGAATPGRNGEKGLDVEALIQQSLRVRLPRLDVDGALVAAPRTKKPKGACKKNGLGKQLQGQLSESLPDFSSFYPKVPTPSRAYASFLRHLPDVIMQLVYVGGAYLIGKFAIDQALASAASTTTSAPPPPPTAAGNTSRLLSDLSAHGLTGDGGLEQWIHDADVSPLDRSLSEALNDALAQTTPSHERLLLDVAYPPEEVEAWQRGALLALRSSGSSRRLRGTDASAARSLAESSEEAIVNSAEAAVANVVNSTQAAALDALGIKVQAMNVEQQRLTMLWTVIVGIITAILTFLKSLRGLASWLFDFIDTTEDKLNQAIDVLQKELQEEVKEQLDDALDDVPETARQLVTHEVVKALANTIDSAQKSLDLNLLLPRIVRTKSRFVLFFGCPVALCLALNGACQVLLMLHTVHVPAATPEGAARRLAGGICSMLKDAGSLSEYIDIDQMCSSSPSDLVKDLPAFLIENALLLLNTLLNIFLVWLGSFPVIRFATNNVIKTVETKTNEHLQRTAESVTPGGVKNLQKTLDLMASGDVMKSFTKIADRSCDRGCGPGECVVS